MFDPEYLCWCFDNAVEWIGGYIENKVMKADDPQAELELLLADVEPPSFEDELLLLRMRANLATGKPIFAQAGSMIHIEPNEAVIRERMKGARS